MTVYIISFTKKGDLLNRKIAEVFAGDRVLSYTGGRRERLFELTQKAFADGNAIIFIGAVGIAVRAVSGFVKSKECDPAVVVCDELGKYAIPILSGHIGGANRIAEKISEYTGAVPVITTATDINGIWAVDCWATDNNFKIYNPRNIKYISSELLKGGKVGIISDIHIDGIPDDVVFGNIDTECGIVVSPYIKNVYKRTLNLIPKCMGVGVGSRKNADEDALIRLLKKVFRENNIDEYAVYAVGTIDLKKSEKSVLKLCKYLGVELKCFTKEEMNRIEGDFSSSEFVKNVMGTDNVCERCAVMVSSPGTLKIKKSIGDGVTLAVAIANQLENEQKNMS